ncbi:NAD(P)-dependent glycerol-3-phosphate dehydrogenase [candidate division WOR-3 bacterium]|nr:NAD(P)-dependent glycerol-3-phosphate dehydrogenase [candidate division WOR-3 bacterium]
MKVSILGAGNWGTTLAIMLSNKIPVTLWTIEKIEGRENKKYLPSYKIPPNVNITTDLKETIAGSKLLVFALPSQAMREVTQEVSPESHTILLSVAKGIETPTLERMSEILELETGVSPDKICVLSGPNIAREVVRGIPASCVCASANEDSAKVVQKLFSSPAFRVYTSTDVLGVELGGALKNVIALAAGICDGLGLGVNTKGALLTRGIREITRLGAQMGADPLTFAGLSGIGDLITTSFSKDSRNRQVGEQIGQGKTLREILNGMVEVAEGVSTTQAAVKLSEKHKVPMPITREVYAILFNGKPPRDGIRDLMTRDPKPEKL